jgi:hypothetical protein
MSHWYPFLGYGVFWIGLVASIILYAMKRKWYPISYLISISLYIFTVGFIIDQFSVGKNGILLILAFSSIVMIGLGMYLAKKVKSGLTAPRAKR